MSKNSYEFTYIVNGVLGDDQIKALVNRVTKFIEKEGGNIIEVDEWGSQRLAYPIDKKRTGYYVNAYFEAEGDLIARLERALTLEDDILRFLTLKMDAVMLRHYEERKQERARAQAESLAALKEEKKVEASAEDTKAETSAPGKKAADKQASDKKAHDKKAPGKQAESSPAPKEEKKAKAPAEDTKAKASAEDTKAKAPAEEKKAKAPAEDTKAKAPAEEKKAKAPAEDTKAKASAEDTKAADQA